MSNTAKGCSDPHILIRGIGIVLKELAHKSNTSSSANSGYLDTVFIQTNFLMGETSIKGLIRNFDVRFERNWNGGTV